MKNLNLLLVAIMILVSQSVYCQKHKKDKEKAKEQEKEIKLMNANDSVFYCLGVDLANNFKEQGLKPFNLELFTKAMDEVFNNGKVLIPRDSAIKFVQKYFMALFEKRGKENKEAGEKFLSANKTKPGVITTKSGLQYQVIKTGAGTKPNRENYVTVKYVGTLIDGTIFDEFYKEKPSNSMPVGGSIPGWAEALQFMNVGSKFKLFVPYNLGYYDRGPNPKVGPYSTLIYEIELISIDK